MLSILIPTYNYLIVELVNRVHKQAITATISFEIIVIDDCSTNQEIFNNNKIIEELAFCSYIKNEKNLGRTATRNSLATKATYDNLLFLDADVLPKYDDFINRFELNINKNSKVIFGGVCYHLEKPKQDQILRWKYGHKRETKNVEDRLQNPFTIVSSSLLIDKEVFFENNTLNSNTYGLDILFSGNLLRNKVNVKHIDNPVYHLGLESNDAFLKKSLEAVKSSYLLEKNKYIKKDVRPLQKSYQLLRKLKLVGVFSIFLKPFKGSIKSNLLSNNPSMFLFDLYRLNYFIELKYKRHD
mgnify:CR=1 FL=1|tara:strand:+ start:30872 stop:31765 length:894 start_codon:yes stop_codon:yes gene_type:complete